jgi:hypothetical protein
MANGLSLKKNPDEAGRNASAKSYTTSLEGGPPSTEYAKAGTPKTTGPNQVIPNQSAPRNNGGKK